MKEISEYTNLELLEAIEFIDQDKYPDRYSGIKNEIVSRGLIKAEGLDEAIRESQLNRGVDEYKRTKRGYIKFIVLWAAFVLIAKFIYDYVTK